jgi:predicted P-loop ATPase
MQLQTVFKKSRAPVIEPRHRVISETIAADRPETRRYHSVFDAVMLHSKNNSFHPLRDYLAAGAPSIRRMPYPGLRSHFNDNYGRDSKDASQHLREKWVVKIAELHSFDRDTTNRLKN